VGGGINLLQDQYYTSSYIYAQLRDATSRVRLILGLSYTSYSDIGTRGQATCPKFGLILTPFPGTTVRAAAFQSLKRPLIADQTIEPTQVAGFTQFFDDINGALSTRYGLAVDQRLVPGSNVGFELTKRDVDIPAVGTTYRWQEDQGRAYLYWPIRGNLQSAGPARWSWALAAEFQHERLDRPVEFTGDEGFVFVDTTYIPVTLSAFPGDYLSIQLRTTYVTQRGQRQINEAFPSYDTSTSFWTTDVEVAYRFPGRRGRLAAGVADLFHGQHNFAEPDVAHPRFAGGQMAFARLTLWF